MLSCIAKVLYVDCLERTDGAPVMNIAGWLESFGLGEYAPVFEENRIGPDVLPGLTDQDLRDLGISALGDRKRLLAAIASLDEPTDVLSGRAVEQSAESSLEGERRQVTVLFADIAGFTSLSERIGAEATHDVLNRYFEAADRIIDDYGGLVDKHIGDNVMGVFGAPIAHDNDPERAVRAALAIHAAVRAITLPGEAALRLHIGIAAGQVVASGTGSASHRHYTVTGDSVNLAARLQALAGPDETLVSATVQRQISGRFRLTGLGAQRLKGIERAIEVWRVEGAAEREEDADGSLFVGRRAELGQCRAILQETARTGQGQVILLRGAAGIGKSRLASEVLRAAREARFEVHRCLVLDFGSVSGQDAIPILVLGLLGFSACGSVAERSKAVEQAAEAGAFAPGERVFLNDLLELPQSMEFRRVYDAMDDSARREGRRSLVSGLVARASEAAPQLILVEDLHWADAQTLDLLAAIIGVAHDCPVVLLGTSRPEGDPLDGAWRAIGLECPVSMINLGPLRPDEARALAVGLTQSDESRLVDCLRRAGGNPLFLEQLLQNIAESTEALLPGSIQSLVLARLDRLEAIDKRAAQAASILGQHFTLRALRHLMDDPAYECSGLLRHQLVRPEGDDLLFTHALIREGVYDSILTANRRALHLKAAEWFASEDATLRAEHLAMAGDSGAPSAYLEAAQSQLRKYRYEQAVGLLEKGRALATEPADRVELALALGEAQHDLGNLEAARAAFERALEAAEDEPAHCRALLGRAAVRRITDDLEGALADLDAAEAEARRQELKSEEARAHYLRGNVLFPSGDIEGCMREHNAALALAKTAGSAELEAAALGGLADAEYLRGLYRTACQRFTECVEISRANGLGRIEVANQPMIAITAHWCGDSQRALDVALESIEAARRVGHSRAEMIAHHGAFLCLRARADFERAREHVNIALTLARRLRARRFEAEALLFAAELDYFMENRSQALEAARAAIAITREHGMTYMGPAILGGLVLATDDEAERRAASEEAEALLAQGSVSHDHVLFRIYAIEAYLREGANELARHHADALAEFCPEEGLDLITFYSDRGRAMARVGQEERSDGLANEIARLIAEAERIDERVAAGALREALDALERSGQR